MQKLGSLLLVVGLLAGCGASAGYYGPAALVTAGEAAALAAANFDKLVVESAPGVAEACDCKAIVAANKSHKIAIEAADGKLQQLGLDGKALVKDGKLAADKKKKAVESAEVEEIERLLDEEEPEAVKGEAKLPANVTVLARIYAGLQKAKPASSEDTPGLTEAKRALRAFIKANTPAKAKPRGEFGAS